MSSRNQTSENLQSRRRLIGRLEDIQSHFGYLPDGELSKLSDELHISLADIVSVASFYAAFRFKPAGKFEIKVCVGSACHVKGADSLYEAFARHLKLSENNDTDADGILLFPKSHVWAVV